MTKSIPSIEITKKSIRQAYLRITNGRPKIVDKSRNITIASVAEESGFSRATIHKYYPDMVEKIRAAAGKSDNVFNNKKNQDLKAEQAKNIELRSELSLLKKNLGVLASKYAALVIKYDEAQAIIKGSNVSVFNTINRN